MARRVIEVFRAGRVGTDGLSNLIGVVTTGVDAAVLNEDSGKAYRCTAALTLTLPAATSPGWSLLVEADGGDVTLASSMTVNGAASIVLQDGTSCQLYSDGSAIFALFFFADPGGALINYAALAGAAFTGPVTIPDLTGTGPVDLSAATVTLPDTVSGGLDSFMALLKAASGVGQVVPISNGVNNGLVVPGTTGQDWFIFAIKVTTPGAIQAIISGWRDGAQGLDGGTGGSQWIGFAVRTT